MQLLVFRGQLSTRWTSGDAASQLSTRVHLWIPVGKEKLKRRVTDKLEKKEN